MSRVVASSIVMSREDAIKLKEEMEALYAEVSSATGEKPTGSSPFAVLYEELCRSLEAA